MRFAWLIVFVFIISNFIACKKDNWRTAADGDLETSSSELTSFSSIYYRNCSDTIYGKDNLSLCFDSLIEDSRCPTGVECVWAGTAIAKFLFKVNNDQREMTLSTLKLTGYPSDTTLMGYKVEFVDLLPYPNINNNTNISDYKAELKVTKQ